MSKKSLENLKETLQYEVDAIAKKGEVDKESLENLYKLTCTMKNIDKLMKSEEGGYSMNSYNSYGGMSMNNGNSNNSYGMSMGQGSYGNNSMRGSYDGGNSGDGRRGRDGDSDGRYSENYSEDGGSYRRGRRGRYSREGGYSRHDAKEKMVMKLETMLEEVKDPKDRMAIEECLEQLED